MIYSHTFALISLPVAWGKHRPLLNVVTGAILLLNYKQRKKLTGVTTKTKIIANLLQIFAFIKSGSVGQRRLT